MKHPEEETSTSHENKQHCECGPDCKCGCKEGKECTCCNHEHCGCKCHCSCGMKVLAAILIFLAGMGFNELLHCGRCKAKSPMIGYSMLHKAGFPLYTDGAGNTIIYINTNDSSLGGKHNFMRGKHHHHKDKNHHDKHENLAPKEHGPNK